MGRRRIMLWHWGRRGGGPRYTLELARALAVRDDVELHLSHSRQAELAAAFAAVNAHHFPVDTYRDAREAALATARLPWSLARWRAHLARHRIEVAICGMGHLWNPLAAQAIRAAGARHVLAVHDAVAHPGEENRLRAWALGWELNRTDGVIALTRHVRDQLITARGYPLERATVLPHGMFTFGPGAARHLPDDRPIRLLFFGRILTYKGFDLLLEAYARLRESFGARVTLEVAGQGDLAPFQARLAELPDVTIDNRWIAEDEVGPILTRADLLVAPYREASQSGVVPSAMGMGLPVVATPVGGLVEQVVDGITGRLATAVTGDAVAQAIASVISDSDEHHRLSRGALDVAQRTLSWDAIADGVVEMARRVIALPPR